MRSDFTLSVLVPVFNERLTVRKLIDRVRAVPIRKEIIIVDDASTDGTTDIVRAIAAERDWGRVITYESFPGDDGRRFRVTATAGDFFTQLALHEVHHRAQIMAMLRGLGGSVPALQDLDYNDLPARALQALADSPHLGRLQALYLRCGRGLNARTRDRLRRRFGERVCRF